MPARARKKIEIKGKLDASKEVKALAREQVGRVKASRPIEPKQSRKKPKYPEKFEDSAT